MVEKRKSPDSVQEVNKTSKKTRETLDEEFQKLRDENLELKNENSKLKQDSYDAQELFEKSNDNLMLEARLALDKSDILLYLSQDNIKNTFELSKVNIEIHFLRDELSKYKKINQSYYSEKLRIILESNIQESIKKKNKISTEINKYNKIIENMHQNKPVSITTLSYTKRQKLIVDLNGDNKIVIPIIDNSIVQAKINNENQCIVCKKNSSEFSCLDGLVSDLNGETVNCDIDHKLFCRECIINEKIKNTSLIEKDNKKVEFGKVSSLGK